MKQPGWRWLPVFLLSLLTACSHLQEHSSQAPVDWQQHLDTQKKLTSWYIEGRLGVRNSKRAGSFDIFWNQQNGRYQIRVLAPLGEGAFMINGNPQFVQLQMANGEIRTASTASELLRDNLGVELPLKSLQDWLRGIPAEGDSELQWNKAGNLYMLRHGQWRVELDRYYKHDGLRLPRAFYLSRIDQPDLSIRLLLRQWQLDHLPALSP